MPQGPEPEVTRLLVAWRDGDESAFERLVPLVYRELHRRAHVCMRGQPPGLTLQTTAVVNEAYLRLVGERAAFLAACGADDALGRKVKSLVAARAQGSALLEARRPNILETDHRGAVSRTITLAQAWHRQSPGRLRGIPPPGRRTGR